MYQALYRKYRPQNFDEVVGQDVIVQTLKNAIKNNKVNHAYLLTGPRGTGKTSIAKVFAKTLNCYNLKDLKPCNQCISCEQVNNNQNIDIIEIDAASNNGVDEIREIRNKISLVPTNSKYKIYIIDEVHMLTTQAFNALLKTLEEPPDNTIFIFATTEPHKIPRTILSRCQRFDYKKLSDSKIMEHLKFIAENEKIKITDEALMEIARLSDGGMRDSISLLDQAIAYCDDEINIRDVHEINGTLLPEDINNFILKMLNHDLVGLLKLIEEYDNNGKNIIKIVQEIINRLKDCLIYLNAPELIDQNDPFFIKIKEIDNVDEIYKHIKSLSKLINDMKNVNDSKLLLEIEIIKNINDDSPNTNNLSKKNNLVIVEEKNTNLEIENSSGKVDNNNENKEKNSVDFSKLEQLKKVRIVNSLCKFSQREREKIKDKLETLNDYLNDEELGKYVSLIKDGELKAVSGMYLMFMYNTELMADSFNMDLVNIENLFFKCFTETYHPIAINLNDWNFIKNDYNSNKEKYVFQKEEISLDDIFLNENNEIKSKNNEIDEMFNDIIEYE